MAKPLTIITHAAGCQFTQGSGATCTCPRDRPIEVMGSNGIVWALRLEPVDPSVRGGLAVTAAHLEQLGFVRKEGGGG
jgi:hypothetical protein